MITVNEISPKCSHADCDQDVYKRYDGKWARHCSKTCQCADAATRGLAKRKKTCLEKYGVENPQQSKEVQAKTQKTCIKKYGRKTPLQAESIKKKIKQTLGRKSILTEEELYEIYNQYR